MPETPNMSREEIVGKIEELQDRDCRNECRHSGWSVSESRVIALDAKVLLFGPVLSALHAADSPQPAKPSEAELTDDEKTTLRISLFDESNEAADEYCRTGPSLEQHSDFVNGWVEGFIAATSKHPQTQRDLSKAVGLLARMLGSLPMFHTSFTRLGLDSSAAEAQRFINDIDALLSRLSPVKGKRR